MHMVRGPLTIHEIYQMWLYYRDHTYIEKTKGKKNHKVMKTCTLQSKVGTNLSNLIEISLEQGSDISFHKPIKQAKSEMIDLILIR